MMFILAWVGRLAVRRPWRSRPSDASLRSFLGKLDDERLEHRPAVVLEIGGSIRQSGLPAGPQPRNAARGELSLVSVVQIPVVARGVRSHVCRELEGVELGGRRAAQLPDEFQGNLDILARAQPVHVSGDEKVEVEGEGLPVRRDVYPCTSSAIPRFLYGTKPG